jgi:excisionase family DNA binding protein
MRTEDPWRNPEEAGNYSRMSRASVYRAYRRGELRGVRVGGRRSLRFRQSWLDRWMEGRERDDRAMPQLG